MKRAITVVFAFLLLALTVAGCGSTATQNGSAPVKRPYLEGYDIPWEKNPLDGRYISKAAEAVVTVAKAYFDRGVWFQYDNNYSSLGGRQLYRVQYHENSPEDLTSQYTGYTNCSGFVYDVFWEALRIDIGCKTTQALAEDATDMHVFHYAVTGTETEIKKREVSQQFIDTVRQGDIVVCRHHNEGGHAFLYIGDGMMLESVTFGSRGGGDYDYSNNRDRIEAQGTIAYRDFLSLLSSDSYNYFWKEKSWTVLRPLDKFDRAEPTEETVNRIKNLKNIYVENTASHSLGQTVDLNEEITFSFFIRNGRAADAVIDITDRIPEHTSYVSGGDSADDEVLSWRVKVPAGESVTVSYTVRVDNDSSLYDGGYIYGEDAKVGGVSVRCRRIFVGKHLSDDLQNLLSVKTADLSGFSQRGIELANALYACAGINIDLPDIDQLFDNLLAPSSAPGNFKLKKDGEYAGMIIPTLYGGRLMQNSPMFERERTRGVKEYQLYAGDIMIGSETGHNYAYMYLGKNRLLDLFSGRVLASSVLGDALMSGWGMERFVFIRPMADIDN